MTDPAPAARKMSRCEGDRCLRGGRPVTPAPSRVEPATWAEPRPTGLRRWVPLLTWLPAYDRRLLRFDAIAGATLWGLLVPESIAYAGLAGMPPQAGLYTLLATLAAYAVLGTSRPLVGGATSAAAVLLGPAGAGPAPPRAADYPGPAAMPLPFSG